MKNDKFILITTSDPPEIISDWTHNLEHLFYQLKFILCEGQNGSFITNIENAIIKAFQVATLFRSIGEDKHLYGKLPSRISNTNIILFTDGGKFSTLNMVKNSEKIYTMQTSNEDFFSHLYRWDFSLYSFVLTGPTYKNILKSADNRLKQKNKEINEKENINNLNKKEKLNNSSLSFESKSIQNTNKDKANENYKLNNTINIIKKYTNLVGGESFLIESFDDLYINVNEFLLKKLFTNYINLRFEFNPNLSNRISQIQSNLNNLDNSTNIPNANINHINKTIYNQSLKLREDSGDNIKLINEKISDNSTNNKFRSSITNLHNESIKKFLTRVNIDYKNFKPIGNNPPEEFLLDRNDGILYREKWPLPDDFVISKKTQKLPKKNSNITYLISSEMLFEIPCKIQDIDEYEISEFDIIIKIIEFFPNVTIEDLLNQFHINELNREIHLKNQSINNLNKQVGNQADKNTKTFNYLKIFFEILMNNLENTNNINNPNNLTILPNNPFAILKLVIPIKFLRENIKNKSNTSERFIDFLKRVLNYENQKDEVKIIEEKEKNNKLKDEEKKIFKDERDHDMIIETIMENKAKIDLVSKNLINDLNPKNINNLSNKNNSNFGSASNINTNGIKLKFCVLPYNYKEFFSIVCSFEKVKLNICKS